LDYWLPHFEYEQHGADRAKYGEQLYKKLSESLKQKGVNGLSFTNLHLFKQFYLAYPQMIQTATEYLQLPHEQLNKIVQTVSEQFKDLPVISSEELLNKLSFSHFVELVKCETPLKRIFYETEVLKNNWSVRELQRAMNSMLFERTGLSTDKTLLLKNLETGEAPKPSEIFRYRCQSSF